MTDDRRDLYRVVALLRELERALHPLAGGERGELRVLPVVPAPLPPTGEPGAAARRSGGTPARPASEWSQRAVPPTARDPITVPWVEPAPIPPSGAPTPSGPVPSAPAADAIAGADIVRTEPDRAAPKPVDRGEPLARGSSAVVEGVRPTHRTEPADTRSPAPTAVPPLPVRSPPTSTAPLRPATPAPASAPATRAETVGAPGRAGARSNRASSTVDVPPGNTTGGAVRPSSPPRVPVPRRAMGQPPDASLTTAPTGLARPPRAAAPTTGSARAPAGSEPSESRPSTRVPAPAPGDHSLARDVSGVALMSPPLPRVPATRRFEPKPAAAPTAPAILDLDLRGVDLVPGLPPPSTDDPDVVDDEDVVDEPEVVRSPSASPPHMSRRRGRSIARLTRAQASRLERGLQRQYLDRALRRIR